MPQTIEATLTINRPDGATLPMLYIEHGTPATFKASIDSAGFFYTVGPVYSEQYLYAKGGVVAEKGTQAGVPATGNPEFAFFTDVDSGLRSGGANILQLVTGGANRLTVDANGNVGIGQTKRLQLNGPGGNKYIWQSDANANSNDPEGLDGRIGFSTNLFIRGSGDMHANGPQLWLGPHANDFLYIIAQETGVSSGKWQMAVQTVLRPDGDARIKPIDWGYGFHPLRIWGKTFLADIGKGQVVLGANPDAGAGAFMPGIYFQKTKHLDPGDGVAYFPDHYGSDGRPYKDAAETVELGGVQRAQGEPNELSVRIWRDATKVSGTNWTLGNDLNFQDVTNGPMKLADLVRSNTGKLKVARGETGLLSFVSPEKTRNFGTVSFNVPSGFFASAPRVFLTPRNSENAWQVSLTAADVTQTGFTLIGGQALAPDHAAYPVSFFAQWAAIGT